MSVTPQPSDRADISPRLGQRCTVVAYGLPRYQRGPFGEWKRRRVGQSTAETHTGGRAPNSQSVRLRIENSN